VCFLHIKQSLQKYLITLGDVHFKTIIQNFGDRLTLRPNPINIRFYFKLKKPVFNNKNRFFNLSITKVTTTLFKNICKKNSIYRRFSLQITKNNFFPQNYLRTSPAHTRMINFVNYLFSFVFPETNVLLEVVSNGV